MHKKLKGAQGTCSFRGQGHASEQSAMLRKQLPIHMTAAVFVVCLHELRNHLHCC